MATREFDFIAGVETSTLPDAAAPSAANDTMTKGYADANYTPRGDVYGVVTDVPAIKALGASIVVDEQLCYIAGLDLFYKYSSASTAVSDDDTVIRPTHIANDGIAGRWLKVVFAGGGGSGSGDITQNILQKLEMEKSGIFTEAYDNSLGASGMVPAYTDGVVARLLKDHAASATSIEVAFNPIYLSNSDKDVEVTTGWTAVGQGSGLTTSATAKIGSASLSFDKIAGGSEAGIQFNRGVVDLALAENNVMPFYIDLPSVTNLSDVYVKIMVDGANYRKFVKTVDVSGSALATGANLMRFDLSAAGTDTGTGWDTSKLAQYVEIGVDTTTNGQTYSAILVDSVCFSLSKPQTLGLNGSEVTLYDTSNKQSVIIDVSNSLYDTRLSLKSGQSLANSYLGGSVNSAAAGVQRSTTKTENGVIGFDSFSSGAMGTASEIRLQRYFRASLSTTLKAVVDLTTPCFGEIKAVGGSTVDIDDPADLHLEYANASVVHAFRPVYNANGEVQFSYIGDKTLTASSTFSSGLTTLTLNVSGLAVGDFIAKSHLTSAQSLVASNANENFSILSVDASPNGVQIIDNYLSYPNVQGVIGSYSLGGALGSTNKKGFLPSLTLAGTLNTGDAFLYGQKSTSGWGGSNFYYIPSAYYTNFDPAVGFEVSFWAYIPAFDGTARGFISNFSTPNNGWGITRLSGSNDIQFYAAASVVTVAYMPNAINFIYMRVKNGDTYGVVNTVKSSVIVGSTTNINQNIPIGQVHSGLGSNLTATDRLASFEFWSGGTALTSQQLLNSHNNGNYRPFGQGGLRYQYAQPGLSGQKLSTKHTLTTSTTTVRPSILKIAAAKTN